ncbi:hypothetical protein ACEWY4_019687 [Coilia grayii]|uniref:AIG1-type G domain-containing protein n=1 Tax=Coilia grayii TaxID=363190 RepID=A0ABD1JAG0_9TELE
MGFRDAGKRSAGNTILQADVFDKRKTVQCVKREGEVSGKHVTVINTPGWDREQRLRDSTELFKEEIILSTTLCPPGPHAVLLVAPVKVKLTETHRMAMQEHLELLGERVWNHSMVLFTCGDWLGGNTIEQHIASEGKVVEWVIEKCGNRYHILNNVDKEDTSQVSELLEKVEEMVKRNDGKHYEIDRQRLLEMEKKKREREKKAKEIMMKAHQCRDPWKIVKDVEVIRKPMNCPPALELERSDESATCPATVAVITEEVAETPSPNNTTPELSRISAPVPNDDQVNVAGPTPELSRTSAPVPNDTGPTPTSKVKRTVTTPSAPASGRRDVGLDQAPSIPTLPVRPTRSRRRPARYEDYHMF